jgi:hypothetical protein
MSPTFADAPLRHVQHDASRTTVTRIAVLDRDPGHARSSLGGPGPAPEASSVLLLRRRRPGIVSAAAVVAATPTLLGNGFRNRDAKGTSSPSTLRPPPPLPPLLPSAAAGGAPRITAASAKEGALIMRYRRSSLATVSPSPSLTHTKLGAEAAPGEPPQTDETRDRDEGPLPKWPQRRSLSPSHLAVAASKALTSATPARPRVRLPAAEPFSVPRFASRSMSPLSAALRPDQPGVGTTLLAGNAAAAVAPPAGTSIAHAPIPPAARSSPRLLKASALATIEPPQWLRLPARRSIGAHSSASGSDAPQAPTVHQTSGSTAALSSAAVVPSREADSAPSSAALTQPDEKRPQPSPPRHPTSGSVAVAAPAVPSAKLRKPPQRVPQPASAPSADLLLAQQHPPPEEPSRGATGDATSAESESGGFGGPAARPDDVAMARSGGWRIRSREDMLASEPVSASALITSSGDEGPAAAGPTA